MPARRATDPTSSAPDSPPSQAKQMTAPDAMSLPWITVGAGLPAKTSANSISPLPDTPPSQASQLPRILCCLRVRANQSPPMTDPAIEAARWHAYSERHHCQGCSHVWPALIAEDSRFLYLAPWTLCLVIAGGHGRRGVADRIADAHGPGASAAAPRPWHLGQPRLPQPQQTQPGAGPETTPGVGSGAATGGRLRHRSRTVPPRGDAAPGSGLRGLEGDQPEADLRGDHRLWPDRSLSRTRRARH